MDNLDNLGIALMVGLFVCCFSLICGFVLVYFDKKAEKLDGDNTKISEEEKFKFSDIKTFNLSFWLICFSCVLIYMGIFPFI